MVTVKMTTEQAVNLHMAINQLSFKSRDEKVKEKLKNPSKTLFRLSVVLKKTKDIFESYAEAEKASLGKHGTEIYTEGALDKDRKPALISQGWNLDAAAKKAHNETMKEIKSEEITLTDIFSFKLSELHTMLTPDDYLAFEPILINDMPEFLEGD